MSKATRKALPPTSHPMGGTISQPIIQRVAYFDIANIVAIIAVIAMHCNGRAHHYEPSAGWISAFIVECLFYFAVPLFCMLSGATLMQYRKRYDTKTFFKKRFSKIFVAFLGWFAITLVYKVARGTIAIASPLDVVNLFFTNGTESVYYFMFVILGIYLTMPLLSQLTEQKHRKTLWLTVGLFFIFNSFLPNVLPLVGIKYNTNLSVQFGSYIIYVLLGYLLSTEDLAKKFRYLIYGGAILGLIYRFTTTLLLSREADSIVKTTWGYGTWHCILLATAVFLLIKNCRPLQHLSDRTKNLLAEVASCSFGIYLCHMLVMRFELSLFGINSSSWLWRSFGIIVVYSSSLALVLIIKKIPFLRRIVP